MAASTRDNAVEVRGLAVARLFTTPEVEPFDTVDWEIRDARIGHGDKVAFEQREVEFPATWSQNATNIVAQKYFRGQLDSPERERSVRQMIGRVAGTIAGWGLARGYFASDADGHAFGWRAMFPPPRFPLLRSTRSSPARMSWGIFWWITTRFARLRIWPVARSATDERPTDECN